MKLFKESNLTTTIATMDFDTLKFMVTAGEMKGFSWIDKFGKNDDVDTGSTPEDVWQGGGLYNWGNDTGETLYVSSSNALDTMDVEFTVETIDALGNWNEEVFVQTMAGQTKTELFTPNGNKVVRCHRMENVGTSDVAGTIYAYYDSTVTAGVPDDLTKVLSVIVNGANQTKQLTYTIPSGKVAFLMRGEAGTTRGIGTDECDFAYKSRRVGGVFKQKKDFGVMTQGSSHYTDNRVFKDPIPAKTDLTMAVTNVSSNNMSA